MYYAQRNSAYNKRIYAQYATFKTEAQFFKMWQALTLAQKEELCPTLEHFGDAINIANAQLIGSTYMPDDFALTQANALTNALLAQVMQK